MKRFLEITLLKFLLQSLKFLNTNQDFIKNVWIYVKFNITFLQSYLYCISFLIFVKAISTSKRSDYRTICQHELLAYILNFRKLEKKLAFKLCFRPSF